MVTCQLRPELVGKRVVSHSEKVSASSCIITLTLEICITIFSGRAGIQTMNDHNTLCDLTLWISSAACVCEISLLISIGVKIHELLLLELDAG